MNTSKQRRQMAEEATAAKPKAAKEKPAAEKKPAAKAAPKGGAFSLGAESLEEFFGLTKKPRLVSDHKTRPQEVSCGA